MFKNRFSKITISTVMCAALLLGEAMPAMAAEEKGSTSVEISTRVNASITQKNAQSAAELKNGTAKTGSLGNNESVYYKFAFTTPGFFQIDFAKESGTVNDGWKYIIYDANLKKVFSSGVIKGTNKSSVKIWAAGTYYMEVTSANSLSAPASDAKYSIKYAAYASSSTGSIYEIEDNNEYAKSTPLTLDATYMGNMMSANDQDWYKFASTGEGIFSINLGPNALTTAAEVGEGWNLAIYTASDISTPIKTYENIKTGLVSEPLTYGEGTYYAKITNSNDKAPALDACYDLKISFINSSEWESEINDTKQTADVLNMNSSRKGNLKSVTDIDYYKLTAGKNGVFQLTLTSVDGDYTNMGAGWKMTIYNSKGTVLFTENAITAETVSPAIAYGKGTFYVAIENENSYAAALNKNYELKVDYTASKYWESENNDTAKKADTIDLKNYYSANLKSATDQDWFKFVVNTTNTINISLTPDAQGKSVRNGWSLYIYKSNGKTLVKKITKIKKTAAANIKLETGTYYVKVVAAKQSKAPIGVTYKVRAAIVNAPKAPTFTSVNATQNNGEIELHWGKVKKCTGYKIYRKKEGATKYELVKTIKGAATTYYFDTNLESGQWYNYVITAYLTKNGVTGESDYSKAVTYKPN